MAAKEGRNPAGSTPRRRAAAPAPGAGTAAGGEGAGRTAPSGAPAGPPGRPTRGGFPPAGKAAGDGPPPGGAAPGEGAPPARRPAGPPWPDAPRRPDLELRALGSLVPRLTRPAFRRRSPAGAALMADWPAVVGPALAAVTVPLRLTRGTLTIACSGPMAMELQHLGPQLMQRINAGLGSVAVEALRFVQQAPARGGPRPAPRPAPAAPLPGPVAERLSGVADPDLRGALERLGQGVYRRR